MYLSSSCRFRLRVSYRDCERTLRCASISTLRRYLSASICSILISFSRLNWFSIYTSYIRTLSSFLCFISRYCFFSSTSFAFSRSAASLKTWRAINSCWLSRFNFKASCWSSNSCSNFRSRISSIRASRSSLCARNCSYLSLSSFKKSYLV